RTTVVVPPSPFIAAPPLVMATPPMIIAGPSLGDVVVGNVIGSAISGVLHSVLPPPPSGADVALQQQQRQDERLLDRQAAEIESLRRELRELQSAGPRAPGAATVLQVTVPEGKSPGQPLAVKAPTGPTYEVKVPEGLAPGQTFNVQLPAGQS
ncbi:unnamed protein product, partial [Prorocentrum cordatum]